MKRKRDYTRDLAEIRAMMQRSSKFLSLSGWAGIMAGIYALAGAWIAYNYLNFIPAEIAPLQPDDGGLSFPQPEIVFLAIGILGLAIGTALFLSYRKAQKRGEKVWNPTSRRLLANMAVPLVAGGSFMLILWAQGFIGWMIPLSLLFYGLAIYHASQFTYDEMKYMGLIQIALGLASACFIAYSLWFWALGFGIVHIVYGMIMHLKYER